MNKSVLEAGEFRAGASAEFDPMAAAGVPGVMTPVNANLMYDPTKQYVGGRGTTVYNILPSDPRMEAIYGERKYKERPREGDPNVQKAEIDELKNKVEMLTNLLAKKVEDKDTKSDSAVDMPYTELLARAKEIDPSLKGRPKAIDLKAIIADAAYKEDEE